MCCQCYNNFKKSAVKLEKLNGIVVNRDYTMIMAITIFLAVLMVVANLLTDIAYKLIDPRITFE